MGSVIGWCVRNWGSQKLASEFEGTPVLNWRLMSWEGECCDILIFAQHITTITTTTTTTSVDR
eukprot:1155970-Pelagomonas_calceolata.AAC.7